MNFPILSFIIFFPLIGALFILFIKNNPENNNLNARYVAIFTSFTNFALTIYLWFLFDNLSSDFQFVENREWLRGYVNFKLGIDGISIFFILLTALIIPICVLSVISSIKSRLKEFLVTLNQQHSNKVIHFENEKSVKYKIFVCGPPLMMESVRSY